MNLAIVGMQFGDEGKGKIVDFLSENFDIVARLSGGSNAGHTVVYEGNEVKFHLLPSGVLRGKIGILGNGMVIDLKKLQREMEMVRELGVEPKILISSRAHVVTSFHRILDEMEDEIIKIGTTKQGIGPSYAAKHTRIGTRIADIFQCDLEKKLKLLSEIHRLELSEGEIKKEARELKEIGKKMKGMVEDTEIWLNNAIDSGKSVLFEGSQASFLDVDFGTYPYVTSSNTTVGGIVTGLGIPPSKIDKVMGIAKAYTTRVGAGPFPTELHGEEGEKLRERGREYGATTGRPRRVGHLDLVLLRYATLINGIDEIALTKVDVLSGMKMVKIATKYECEGEERRYPPANISNCEPIYEEIEGWDNIEDENLQKFVGFIEKETGAKVKIVSYGASREDTIMR